MMRGFGMLITGGLARYWYVDKEGVQRWVDNDKPVNPPPPPEDEE